MAHSHWPLLQTLVSLLDHPRVDFYIHIDKKASYPQPDPLRPHLSHSGLHYIPRRRVNWGGRSQIACEFDLIRASLPGDYAYYHLISGVDLPLKPVEEILAFFDANQGKEFVHFDSDSLSKEQFERFRFYYPFQEWTARHPVLNWIQWRIVGLERRFKIDRVKNAAGPFAKGANWFSCTHAYLSTLVKEEAAILKRYANTRCCDEVFLQSHLVSTPFREHLYDSTFSGSQRSNMRAVDWERGEPYTFQDEDLEPLLNSPYLFARKFDEQKSPHLISKLMHRLKGLPPEDNV